VNAEEERGREVDVELTIDERYIGEDITEQMRQGDGFLPLSSDRGRPCPQDVLDGTIRQRTGITTSMITSMQADMISSSYPTNRALLHTLLPSITE
jgi:hypothetical protein